jgi:hypothetical protein
MTTREMLEMLIRIGLTINPKLAFAILEADPLLADRMELAAERIKAARTEYDG